MAAPREYQRVHIRRWQGRPYILLSEPAFREGVQRLPVIPLDPAPEWDEENDCATHLRLHDQPIRQAWIDGEGPAYVYEEEGPYALVLLDEAAGAEGSRVRNEDGSTSLIAQVRPMELPVELVPVTRERGRAAQVEQLVEQAESAIGELWLRGELLTSAEVAETLGVSLRRVQQLARSRGVGQQVGREWLFRPEDVEQMRDRKPGRPRVRHNNPHPSTDTA